MNRLNEKIVNGENPSIIWTQYMDFLSEFGRQMKSTYTKRMRANQPITWSELDVINKQIHDKLDYLMTWSEKFNQNNNTTQQQNNPQVQPTTESVKRHTNKVRLSESQLHNIVKESIRKIIRESRELPEVHFCKSYRHGINETRFQVLCEYGDSIVAGCFDVDNSTNKLTFVSDFDTVPYNRETMIGDESKRNKLSSEESAFIAKEILRTGQTSDLEDMWWYRKTEGIFRMIPR